MFSTLRTRFGIPGVISVIALVFAMLGGAYAASNSSSGGKATASAKSKRGPRGPKGATGPAGPAGPAGPQGAKGDTGAAGANGNAGTNGANGKTVLSGTAAPEGAVTGNVGDFYIRTSTSQIFGPKTGTDGTKTGWGAATSLVGPEGEPGADGTDGQDGEDGSPWVVGTAPSGATLKGTWSIHLDGATAGEVIPLPISTDVPVNTTGFGLYIPVAEQNDPNNPLGCTGSAAQPTPTSTAPNAVCIYEKANINLTPWGLTPAEGVLGIGEGALVSSGGGNIYPVKATANGNVDAYGTWAMKTG